MLPSRFSGVHALVTGATSGIGRAIAVALAEDGAKVAVVGRDSERLAETEQQLLRSSSGHLAMRADLTDGAHLASIAERSATFAQGRLDLCVLCAGHHEPATVEATTASSLDAAFATNLRAPFLLTAALLPALRAARGMLVLVNSSVVMFPRAGTAAYAASKAALRTFGDCLRHEVSPDGVRVLSIFPGRTATPMQRERYERDGLEYRPERLMQPEDVALAVLDAFASKVEVTELHLRPSHKI